MIKPFKAAMVTRRHPQRTHMVLVRIRIFGIAISSMAMVSILGLFAVAGVSYLIRFQCAWRCELPRVALGNGKVSCGCQDYLDANCASRKQKNNKQLLMNRIL